MIYPLACFAVRLAATWVLLPLGRLVVGKPLLWLWMRLVWQPRWWLSAPAVVASLLWYLRSHSGAARDYGCNLLAW